MAVQLGAKTSTRYADAIAAFVKRYERFCLIILLLCYGLTVRHTGALKPLWFDEVGTLTVSTQPTLHRMFVAAEPDGQPPLQYLVIRGVLHLLPYSEFVLRLPALLCMLLAVLALYLFLRSYCSAPVALVGVSAFITPDIIRYGAEARPYAFMVAFTALLLLCWHRAAGERRAPLWLAGVALSTAFLILSQPYGCFYVGPVLVAEAFRSRLKRSLDWGMIAALAIGLTAIVVTLWSSHATRLALFTGLPTNGIPFARPRKLDVPYALLHELGNHGSLLLCIGLVALPLGLQRKSDSGDPSDKSIQYRSSIVAIVALILLCPFIWIFASLTTHYFWERYVLPSTIGVIGGITLLINRIPQRRILAAGLLLAIPLPLLYHALRTNAPRPSEIDAILLKLPPGPQRIVYGDALDYPVVWHYAPPELRSRLVALRDRKRLMSYSIDWMPDITLDAHADRGTYPTPVEAFDTFVANTPQFFFYDSGKTPDRNWALSALRAEGKHVDQVATGQFEDALTHLYLVH